MEHLLIEFYAYRKVHWSMDDEEVYGDVPAVKVVVCPSQIVRIEEWILGDYYRILMANGDAYFVQAEWYWRIINILDVLAIDPNGCWSDRHFAVQLQAAIAADKAKAEKERAEEEKEPEPYAGVLDDPNM